MTACRRCHPAYHELGVHAPTQGPCGPVQGDRARRANQRAEDVMETACGCHPACHDLGFHAPTQGPPILPAAVSDARAGLRLLWRLVLARCTKREATR